MKSIYMRVGLLSLAVGALGIAVLAQVRQVPQRGGTIVVTDPSKTSRLHKPRPKVSAAGEAKVMSAADVRKVQEDLGVKPTATRWQDVTLDARHTSFPRAKLDLCGASIFNASDNYIFLEAEDGLHGEVQVNFSASKAGDTYLVTYYVHTNAQNTMLKVISSGNSPIATMNVGPGDHAIPVAVVTNTSGNQYVMLLLWYENGPHAMYVQRVDIQLLGD